MNPAGFALVTFLVLMLFLRVAEQLYLEKQRTQGKIYANWTLFFFGLIYILTLIATIGEFFLFQRSLNLLVSGIGLILLLVRLLIKIWSVRTLGKYWSHNIEIRERQELIRCGPYAYLRHPVYFARLLELVGIPLILNSYLTLFFSLPLNFVLIFLRIRLEEKALLEKFGNLYQEYREKTGALIPKFF